MTQMIEVRIPDIGGYKDVPVIEIVVKPGDTVAAEDTLLMLESDKATMDVPAPTAGVVKEIRVKIGDKVAEGTLVVVLESPGEAGAKSEQAVLAPAPASTSALVAPAVVTPEKQERAEVRKEGQSAMVEEPVVSAPTQRPLDLRAIPPGLGAPQAVHMPSPAEFVAEMDGACSVLAHASPSIRRFARELGVDVAKVRGSGPKGRITREDVHAYVKAALAAPAGAVASTATQLSGQTGQLNLLPWPKVDFAKFGPIETQPLSRIQKISGANLARNWVMIPHVTQFDEADIGDLEAFRVAMNKEHDKEGVKLTMLAFLIKASVAALEKFPMFNASLYEDTLILKRYCHIGFAADTPNGLVVPVIRDADKKGILDIAREMATLSKKARDGKLLPTEMQGGCFSISSLGGIGGTAFTPIINAPEVAILGVSKSEMKPKWDGQQFVPRLMLPLSLSYDHRVIDGATAARFTAYFGQLLADMRRTLL